MSVHYLERRTDKCKGCPLFKDRRHKCTHIPTEVHIQKKGQPIKALFLGEAPGEEEDAQCRNFIGRSGTLFRKILKQYIKEDENYAIMNVVRCRPVSSVDGRFENRQPSREERRSCLGYTLRDLKKLKPEIVVAMGGQAAGAFIDKFKSVADIRGTVVKVENPLEGYKFDLLPTYHPAFVLREPYRLSYYREDIARSLGRGVSSKWGKKGKVKTLDTVELVEKFVHHLQTKLSHKDVVALDVETTNELDRVTNSISCISFAWNGKKGFVIPLDHKKSPWSPKEFKRVKELLRELFSNPVSFGYWLAHNAFAELQQIFLFLGVWLRNVPVLDSMFMRYLLDENRLTLKNETSCYGLKHIVREDMGFTHYPKEMYSTKHDAKGEAIKKMKYRELLDYNAMDSYVTRREYSWIKQQAGDYWPQLFTLAKYIGARGIYMFARTEMNGFKADVENLAKLQGKNSAIDQAMEKIEEWFKNFKPAQKVNARLANVQSGNMSPLFGMPWVFDLNNKDCKVELFVRELGLEPMAFGAPKKNDPKQRPVPSIDKEFINHYKPDVPGDLKTDEEIENFLKGCTPAEQAVYKYAEWTGLYKLKTSYIKSIAGFLKESNECRDGRIRARFGLTNTVTGRPASHDPNLQQVPKGDNPYKKAIKNIFSVEPPNILVSTDYTQGEVYLLAQVAQDKQFAKLLWNMSKIRLRYYIEQTPELAKQVKEECDVHRQTASLMFGVPIGEVTKQQRQSAKGIVFGLVYGQSTNTLAKNLGIDVKEAEKLVEKFFSKFPHSRKWLTEIENYAKAHHYAASPLGRRRRLPMLMSGDEAERARGLRQARNSPIQSFLSDLCIFAASELQAFIDKYHLPWKIVDVVHDAIISEVPFSHAHQYAVVAEKIMTNVAMRKLEKHFKFKFIVPMAVEFEFGTHYGSMEEWGVGENDMPFVLKRIRAKWKEKGYRIAKRDRNPICFFDDDLKPNEDYYEWRKHEKRKERKAKKAA